MLQRQVSLRSSIRGRLQSLPPTSGIGLQIFSGPRMCVNSLRSPLGWYQATRKAHPSLVVRIGSGLRTDSAHNTWRQLRDVGKVIREVIQEVVD